MVWSSATTCAEESASYLSPSGWSLSIKLISSFIFVWLYKYSWKQSYLLQTVVVPSSPLLSYHPLGCSRISLIPIRPWLLSDELGGEVSLNHTRHSYMVKEGGTDCSLAKMGSESKDNLSCPDSFRTLLPLIVSEWNSTTVTGVLKSF